LRETAAKLSNSCGVLDKSTSFVVKFPSISSGCLTATSKLEIAVFDSFKVSAIFTKKADWGAFGGFCKLLRLLAQNAESGDHIRGEIFSLCVLHVE
jgi:hypothetical protein